MAKALATPDSLIEELTEEEGKALLEERARRFFGMSADEFMASWREGKFQTEEEDPRVVEVSMLLPFANGFILENGD